VQSKTANISIDDDTLVEQSRQGDSAAMGRLILKYQNRIYNAILKICANPEDALELTQETFVKVIENISGFQGRSGFYTWTFRIAVNLTLNHCKRKVKLTWRSLDDDEQLNHKPGRARLKEFLADDNSPDPAVVARDKELCEIVAKSLLKLAEDQRAVLVLRDIENMNYAQIANVLNIELGTVKSRISRARSNLRGILETVVK